MKTIKITTTLVLIILTSICALAQFSEENFDVKWGKEAKAPRKGNRIVKIVNSNESKFYAIRSKYEFTEMGAPSILIKEKENVIYLESVSKQSLNVLKSVEVDMTYERQELLFYDFFEMNGQLILLSTVLDKKKDVATLYGQKVNKTTLTPEKDHVILAEMKFDKKLRGVFRTAISEDSSKLAVIPNYLMGLEEIKTSFEMSLIVFDSNLDELWSQKIDLTKREENLIYDFVISNDGKAYIATCKNLDWDIGTQNHYLYQLDGKNREECPITLDDVIITTNRLMISAEKINILGFFSHKNSEGITGCFNMILNPKTLSVDQIQTEDFSQEILLSDLTEKQEEKIKSNKKKSEKLGLTNYLFPRLITIKDNHIYFFIEQSKISLIDVGDRQKTIYHANDILIIDYSFNGEILKISKIHKKQGLPNQKYTSFTLFMIKDQPHFVINGIVQLGQNEPNLLKGLDKNGKEYTTKLNDSTGSNKLPMCPKVSKQTSPNELILYAEFNDRFRFGKVTFKN